MLKLIMDALNYILSAIKAHEVLSLYILLGLVNAMRQPYDGLYNYLYRFVHLMLNIPQIQSLEQKHSIIVSPSGDRATETFTRETRETREAPPLPPSPPKQTLTQSPSSSSVVGGIL